MANAEDSYPEGEKKNVFFNLASYFLFTSEQVRWLYHPLLTLSVPILQQIIPSDTQGSILTAFPFLPKDYYE